MMPTSFKNFSTSLVAVSSFSSNILFWCRTNYWDVASELKPLLHTWSLSVEEQYYVFFPLFLMLLWRYRKRWILATLLCLLGVSIATAQWAAYHLPAAAFYLLPTRAWELGIGACLAFYYQFKSQGGRAVRVGRWLDEIMGGLGLFMIAFAVFAFNEETPFPSLYALVPTLGTALILVYASSRTIVGRLLSLKPLVGIGLISYSAYLWHQPLFALTRYQSFYEPKQYTFWGLILLTLLLAYLSWKFVEQPFRNRNFLSRKFVFIFSIVGSMTFFAIGLLGYHFDGFKQRNCYSELLVKHYQPDNSVLSEQTWNALRALSNNGGYGVEHNEFDQKLWFLEDDVRRDLLLVGNSHSKDLYNILLNSERVKDHFQVARYGTQIEYLADPDFELYS